MEYKVAEISILKPLNPEPRNQSLQDLLYSYIICQTDFK
jgi:hypothetical protein